MKRINNKETKNMRGRYKIDFNFPLTFFLVLWMQILISDKNFLNESLCFVYLLLLEIFGNYIVILWYVSIIPIVSIEWLWYLLVFCEILKISAPSFRNRTSHSWKSKIEFEKLRLYMWKCFFKKSVPVIFWILLIADIRHSTTSCFSYCILRKRCDISHFCTCKVL